MKQKILLLTISAALLFSTTQCAFFNAIGVAPGRIKGEEARKKISEAASTSDFIYYVLIEGTFPSTATTLTSSLTPVLVGIKDDGYYLEKDVDKCVDSITTIGTFVLSPFLVGLLKIDCDIQEDKAFMDSPFPEI
ncbi:TIGR04452 family lipoprotein [Leptospira gomenensis]|uniref:TIGR04452 family lipoprotein n=1 Tax=Leptospira gomenensis TaxID=2484974 RepID=A0A5F1YA27_9LEPT|nr:TIGR04452 family lipoprotein [Leptospira gomenensis]TGK33321.1 TIGR04452 family lipoprotein [Leptospira gomenensis]TGK37383.1 TIGR04452 family lipoprotein [Leptospira gomenensis]TGK50871.1 TIGR04452 family lipoprotein [Leptospira gomenensis]TGK56494.1 TIGR04452 family lipoprotein [Leptospira gomenensis]